MNIMCWCFPWKMQCAIMFEFYVIIVCIHERNDVKVGNELKCANMSEDDFA